MRFQAISHEIGDAGFRFEKRLADGIEEGVFRLSSLLVVGVSHVVGGERLGVGHMDGWGAVFSFEVRP